VCYFGECTIEISTRAQHPGVPVFYVWVETVTTDATEDYRIEKFTNYQISATTGLQNCESGSTFITGFCQSTVKSLSKVYAYRDVVLRNAEAQARFDNFLCRCNPPTAQCLTELTRFSCLESFRECDSGGFWTPICRGECENVASSCGPFEESDGSCACTRPEFACTNSRYSDAVTSSCTGVQSTPTPTPSPSPITSATHVPSGQSKAPTSSGGKNGSPSSSSSHGGGKNSPSSSHNGGGNGSKSPSSSHNGGGGNGSHTPSASPHHGTQTRTSTPEPRTIIKYYFNSPASSLSVNLFFALVAVLLALLV
jgi:hypothetical protein